MSSASDSGSSFSCNVTGVHQTRSSSILNINTSAIITDVPTGKKSRKSSVNNNNNNEEEIALFADTVDKCDDYIPNISSASSSPYDRKLSSRKSFGFATDFTLDKAILGVTDKSSRSIDLIWRNVNYSVESGSLFSHLNPFSVVTRKNILNGLTGSISTGEITAVIGPSGAGKSSFLEILAGRREKGFTGDLFVKFANTGDVFKQTDNHFVPPNGKSRAISSIKSTGDDIKIAFMAQKDIFSPNLTVKETLVYASRLKNYNCQAAYYEQLSKLKKVDTDILSMSYRIKSEIDNFHYNLAAEIMEELSLLTCAHVKVGKCSGGQQKRLSIACELVSHPDILILDEPTSGLDSFSAFQCVQLLRKLSKSKSLAVILSIHQPSSQTLALFDQLYVMSHNGYNFYHGSASGLLPYLKENSFTCPLYYNPADFITEIASGDMGSEALDRLIKLQFDDKKSSLTLSISADSEKESRIAISRQSSKLEDDKSRSTGNVRIVKLKKVLDQMMSQPLPLWYHTKILLIRTLLIMWREPMLASLSLFQHLFVGITMGVIFSDKSAKFDGCYKPEYTNSAHFTLQTLKNFQKEEIYTQQNVGFLFFSMLFLYLASMMMTVLTFPLEMGVFIKERTNRWYSCLSYYMARTIADTPFRIFFPIIYTIITYKMTGQIDDDFRFTYFISLNVLIAFVAQSKGLLIGSMYANRVDSAVFVAPLSIVPFLLFAGFFVHLDSLPTYLQALPTISYFKYAFESSIVVIYGFNRCASTPLDTENVSTSPFYDLHFAMKTLNLSLPQMIPSIEYALGSRSVNDTVIDDLVIKIKRAHNATVDMFDGKSSLFDDALIGSSTNSTTNSFILQHFDVDDTSLVPCVIALFIFFFVFRILSYFVLLYKSAPKK